MCLYSPALISDYTSSSARSPLLPLQEPDPLVVDMASLGGCLLGRDSQVQVRLRCVFDVAEWARAAAGRSPGWRASQSRSICQHVIRQAVAVARLVGVPTSVHVRQVERPNGAQHAAAREEFADRGGAPHIDAENVLAAREEITDVFGRRDAVLEKGFVHMARRG